MGEWGTFCALHSLVSYYQILQTLNRLFLPIRALCPLSNLSNSMTVGLLVSRSQLWLTSTRYVTLVRSRRCN